MTINYSTLPEHMRDWVVFFYNEAPAACFGSEKQYSAWLKHGGILGAAA